MYMLKYVYILNKILLMIEEYFLDDKIGTKFACVKFLFSLRYYSILITL